MVLSERQYAILALLAQADPDDLPPRAHVQRFDGHPNRRERYRRLTLMRWLTSRDASVDGDVSAAEPARRQTKADHWRLAAMQRLRQHERRARMGESDVAGGSTPFRR